MLPGEIYPARFPFGDVPGMKLRPVLLLTGSLGAVPEVLAAHISAMAGRQLPFFSLIVPFWVVWAFAGFRGMMGVWPAALVAGLSFAIPQFLVSNFHGPWLVDVVASLCSLAAVVSLLKFWQPRDQWKSSEQDESYEAARHVSNRAEITKAWVPWILLSLIVFLWGLPPVKDFLNAIEDEQVREDCWKIAEMMEQVQKHHLKCGDLRLSDLALIAANMLMVVKEIG